MTKLNSLPDLCLLKIFDRIPLGDLLGVVNQVNPRWNSLLPSAIIQRRRSIHHPLYLVQNKKQFELSNGLSIHAHYDLMNLVVDSGEEEDRKRDLIKKTEFEYQRYGIECAKINTIACERLTSLFPNLTSLHFIQLKSSFCQIDHIIHLLSEWQSSLVHLKLWFCIPSFESEEDLYEPKFQSLFDSINSLENLKQLDLNLYFSRLSFESLCVTLPIVSQLEVLKYGGINGLFEKSNLNPFDVRFPLESLKLYGEPTLSLKEVHLDHDLIEEIRTFDQFILQFAKRFVSICLLNELTQQNVQEYENLFQKFSALKSVRFFVRSVSIHQLSTVLSHLPHLENLSLRIIMDGANIDDEIEHLPILGSIKALSIELDGNCRNHLEWLNLHRVFPSLQVIRLNLFRAPCSECHDTSRRRRRYSDIDRPNQMLSRQFDCARKTLMSLKRCEKLKKVLLRIAPTEGLDDGERFYEVDELFEEFGI